MTKVLLYELGQSISYGRLPLLGKLLWPMLLASSDDQGRGLAEPDVIKWHVCPNVPELTVDNIPEQLGAMEEQDMIHIYQDSRDRRLYQIVHWWEFQKLQYARPSRFPPCDGWTDRIRYTIRGKGQTLANWERPGGFDADWMPPPAEDQGADPGGDPPGNQAGRPDQPNLREPNRKKGPEPGADAPPGGFTVPASYEEWLETVREPPRGSNRIAVLVNMHNTLYPGRDPPSHSFMGSAAKKVGGAGNLCRLLWMHSASNIAGDVLPYILAAFQRAKQGAGSDRHEPKSWAALRQYAAEEGVEWEL